MHTVNFGSYFSHKKHQGSADSIDQTSSYTLPMFDPKKNSSSQKRKLPKLVTCMVPGQRHRSSPLCKIHPQKMTVK